MRGFRGWGWRGPGPPIGVPFALNDQSPQAQGLVAWWPTFPSAGQPVVRDITTIMGLATIIGASWSVSDTFGPVLRLSADGHLVTFPAIAKPTAAFTITLWVNPATWTANQSRIFGGNGLQSSPGKGGIALSHLSPTIYYDIYDSDTRATASFSHSLVPLNTWTLVCVSWDGSQDSGGMQAYTNGISRVSGTATGVIPPLDWGTNTFSIGKPGSLYWFDGMYADFRVYNRALSAAKAWQGYDPATRYDLIRPLLRRLWAVPSVGGWPRILGRPVSAVSPAAPLVRRYLP